MTITHGPLRRLTTLSYVPLLKCAVMGGPLVGVEGLHLAVGLAVGGHRPRHGNPGGCSQPLDVRPGPNVRAAENRQRPQKRDPNRPGDGSLEGSQGCPGQREKATLAELWDHHNLVFPNQTGKPMHPWVLVGGSFKKLLTRAGLPTATRFHDLRHTCATLLLTKGVHPKIVQEMLGHSSITITLDIYSNVLPNMQERAVSAMEDVFEGS